MLTILVYAGAAVAEIAGCFFLARYLEYPSGKGGGAGLNPNGWKPGSNAYAKAKGG
ncbi:hypothetical protein [Phyllobacterium zundukense]|uniref:Uncharacterized protein n=1 Tax=Phyllobacterium zundukense TaxID=1867719 RepID=A0ACD4CXD8_9HYPH|nr:hypothetical protein [Phyllobacterium zundukense]UXN58172.1 hypothetical protein N8E88_04950 [Phyllobacterium zundukense]